MKMVVIDSLSLLAAHANAISGSGSLIFYGNILYDIFVGKIEVDKNKIGKNKNN